MFRLIFAFLLLACPAHANPLPATDTVGPIKWKKGATIDVYIPLDPSRNDPLTPRTRDVQIKQAIAAWQQALTDAGANLTLHPVSLDAAGNVPATGHPPDTSTATPDHGAISIKFAPVSGEHGDAVPGTLDPPGTGKTGPLVTDDVTIDNSTTALTNVDNAKALGTALHELGHALGLDHTDEEDSVMHAQSDLVPKTTVGASDIRELKASYSAANVHLDDTVVALASGEYAYTVTANWLSGGEVAMVQILTGGAAIDTISVPAGWTRVNYPGAANVLTFRIDPTDTLQAYLNAGNPLETFAFDSFAAPASTLSWAGDFGALVGPVAVPAPAVWGVWLLAAAAIARLRQRANPCQNQRRFQGTHARWHRTPNASSM